MQRFSKKAQSKETCSQISVMMRPLSVLLNICIEQCQIPAVFLQNSSRGISCMTDREGFCIQRHRLTAVSFYQNLMNRILVADILLPLEYSNCAESLYLPVPIVFVHVYDSHAQCLRIRMLLQYVFQFRLNCLRIEKGFICVKECNPVP